MNHMNNQDWFSLKKIEKEFRMSSATYYAWRFKGFFFVNMIDWYTYLYFFFMCIFQSVKPKTGLFCFLITEARVTTALEMPDHENAFVLKVN